VGSGFAEAELKRVGRLLEPLARDASPFTAGPKPPKEVHFVAPEFVAAVEYGDITDTGTLRHPRYKGLRDDLDPADVRYPEEG
jgi:bifunctional non-homologous end joining protein LigD